MREFHDYERTIISKINEYSKRGPFLFNNILQDEWLFKKQIIVNTDLKYAVLQLDRSLYNDEDAQTLIDDVRATPFEIVTIMNVINILLENAYMVSYFENAPESGKPIKYGHLAHTNNLITSQIHDKNIIQSLIDLNMKSISGTEILKEFVQRGFITKEEKRQQEEEQRQKEDLKIAKNALIIAVLLGGLDLIIGIIELCHSSHQVHLLEKLYHLFKWS